MQDKEHREIRAYRRLGTYDAVCVVCGESNPHCLQLHQQHHLAGRKYSDDTAALCLNCHKKVTDAQLDHPDPAAKAKPTHLEVIGRYLLGLAELFEMLAQRLREFGSLLIEAAANCPPPYGRMQMEGA